MKLVNLESPYAGDVEANLQYARACMKDSLLRGEAPIASHLLYTQEGILDDNVPEQRELGIHAGFAWNQKAEATVVYIDRGLSRGMQYGIKNAIASGRPVEYRAIWIAYSDAMGKIQKEVFELHGEQHGQVFIGCRRDENGLPHPIQNRHVA
jgi:hypothetical protein